MLVSVGIIVFLMMALLPFVLMLLLIVPTFINNSKKESLKKQEIYLREYNQQLLKSGRVASCPNCGHPRDAADRDYCGHCGKSLLVEARELSQALKPVGYLDNDYHEIDLILARLRGEKTQ